MEPGRWGRTPGEHSGRGGGSCRPDGAPWEPPSACDRHPRQGGCWDRLAGGSSVSAKCPDWTVGTSLCSDSCPNSCLSIPSLPREPRARVASAEQEMEVVGTASPLVFSWMLLTPVASPCPCCLRLPGSHRVQGGVVLSACALSPGDIPGSTLVGTGPRPDVGTCLVLILRL